MRKLTLATAAIFLVSCPYTAMNALGAENKPQAEEEKMQSSREMFPSPYQEEDFCRVDTQFKAFNDNWTLPSWNWIQKDGSAGGESARALAPIGNEDDRLFFADLIYQGSLLTFLRECSLHISYRLGESHDLMQILPPGTLASSVTDGNFEINPKTWVGFTLFPEGVNADSGGREKHYSVTVAGALDHLTIPLLRFGAGFEYLSKTFWEKKNFSPGFLDVAPLPDGAGAADNDLNAPVRKTFHGLIQKEWTVVRPWELAAGVRYDHDSDFGSTINPRLALVWAVRPKLTSKLMYGKVFSPSSSTESYMKNNPVALGDASPDCETINTVELAFDYQPTNTLLTIVNLFTYDIDGWVDYSQDPGQAIKTARNATDRRGGGFELEADWQPTDTLRLRGNLTYQRADDKAFGEIVPVASALQFHANSIWQFMTDWSLDCQYFYICDRLRAADDVRPDIKDHQWVNFTMRRGKIAKQWGLALTARNLFDEAIGESNQMSIHNDFPMEGRSIRGEISFHY